MFNGSRYHNPKEVMVKRYQTKPYMLHNVEGEFLHALGAFVSIKASSEQTGGVFNLFEVSCPPGFATPLLIHYAQNVTVYVLEGALTFFWGTEKMKAVAGFYFFQPRGTPHGFGVTGDRPARVLYLTIPAGFDQFMREGGHPANCSESMTAAARYKIEILGPLPG